jgi:hypothetical protein
MFLRFLQGAYNKFASSAEGLFYISVLLSHSHPSQTPDGNVKYKSVKAVRSQTEKVRSVLLKLREMTVYSMAYSEAVSIEEISPISH